MVGETEQTGSKAENHCRGEKEGAGESGNGVMLTRT